MTAGFATLRIQHTGSHPPASLSENSANTGKKRTKGQSKGEIRVPPSIRAVLFTPYFKRLNQSNESEEVRSKSWAFAWSWRSCSPSSCWGTWKVLQHFQAFSAGSFCLPGILSRSKARATTAAFREILSFASKLAACWPYMVRVWDYADREKWPTWKQM